MSLSEFYEDLTLHIVPGPRSFSYFVPVLLLFTAFLVPSTTFTHRQLALLFLPLIYLFQLHAWSKMGSIDVISVDIALWSFALLAYYDPRDTFRRIRVRDNSRVMTERGGHTSSETWEQAYPSKFTLRIPWVFSLLLSFRFTGWKTGYPSRDQARPPETTSQGAFVKNISFTIIHCYFLLDIACSYVQTDPYFFQHMAIDEPFPQHQATNFPVFSCLRILPPRLVRSCAIAAQIHASVNLMFLLPTLPAVMLNALGILPNEWSPQNWPPIFGPFSALTHKGLRGLWGSWWHQMNRHLASTRARLFNQSLGVANSSSLGYTSLVVTSFFLSGVMHMGLVPPELLNTAMSPNEIRFYWGAFFWIQIPGFALDTIILRLLDNLALPRLVKKVLVLSWLVIWLSLCLPILAISFRELGYWDVYPLPISPLHGFTERRWLMW